MCDLSAGLKGDICLGRLSGKLADLKLFGKVTFSIQKEVKVVVLISTSRLVYLLFYWHVFPSGEIGFHLGILS